MSCSTSFLIAAKSFFRRAFRLPFSANHETGSFYPAVYFLENDRTLMMSPSRLVPFAASLFSAIGLGCFGVNAAQPPVAGAQTVAAGQRWVSTWACAPQLTEPQNLPPKPGLFTNTLRQMVHVSIGGKRLRVEFSNAFGTNSITIDRANIAISAGAGAIEPSSQRTLSFNGNHSITITPGDAVHSDPHDS